MYMCVRVRAHQYVYALSTKCTIKYIIEYWGKTTLNGESAEIGSATSGSYVYVFQTSAQSTSGKGAHRTVQSVYVTGQAP
jgi:hypothetical protein